MVFKMHNNKLLKHLLSSSENDFNLKIPQYDEVKDFYWVLTPLILYIENEINKIFNNSPADYDDKCYFVSSIVSQINIFVKNKYLSSILTIEKQVLCKAGYINDSSDESLYKYSLLSSSHEWIEYLHEKYPLLFERLNIIIENIITHVHNLSLRFEQDQSEIATLLKVSSLKIYDISLFSGDQHQNGQSVCILMFSDGQKIVYKPRSTWCEVFFLEFINFLNTEKNNINIGVPAVIDKESYSWTQFIEHTCCTNLSEVYDFYFMQGKALCIFYLLGTSDIISDNIISVGNRPYFIDLECLFTKNRFTENSSYVMDKYNNSVIRVGMLPFWNYSDDYVKNSIFSSLAATEIDDDAVFLPSFSGKTHGINEEYLESFLKGFKEMYFHIETYKKSIIQFLSKSILMKKSYHFRVVLHPTATYDILINELNSPEISASALNHEVFKDKLTRLCRCSSNANDKSVVKSIHRQIFNGDIPYFSTGITEDSLFAKSNNFISPKFFNSKSIIDQVLNQCEEFNLTDYKLQSDLIYKTIDLYWTIKQNKDSIQSCKLYFSLIKPSDSTANNSLNSNNTLLEISNDIAVAIKNQLFKYKGEINYINDNRDINSSNYYISPMNYDIYDGMTGLALLYTYLYKYTNDSSQLEISLTILENSKQYFYKLLKNGYYSRKANILKSYDSVSPFSFPMSTLFLMDHLSSIDSQYWDDSFFSDSIDWLNNNIKGNLNFDILRGQSGTLELLLNFINRLNTNSKLKIEQTFSTIITQLLNSANTSNNHFSWKYKDFLSHNFPDFTFGGYAHGSAGIAAALFRYCDHYRSNDLAHKMAHGALHHDRSYYNEQINGWGDNRFNDKSVDSSAWCHGSTGIALSRLLIMQYNQVDGCLNELEIAQNNIIKHGLGNNQSICHGDMSALEVLYSISTITNNNRIKKIINNRLNVIIDTHYQNEYKLGQLGSSGSMFIGYTGIAYGLLRLYDYVNIPSIISLESSLLNNHNLHKTY